MPAIVVSGAQWGDEGKGKLVDYLARAADVVVRFQGGNNAGHTLVVNGKKTKLQLTPCGILHSHTRCVIGAGVVANPKILAKEFLQLKEAGIEVTPQRLLIDRDAHLVLDYHPVLDKARELTLGDQKIGTTGLGIGPAYEDRAGRRGVRFGDLLDLSVLQPRLELLVAEKNLILSQVLKSSEQVLFSDVWRTVREAAELLTPYIGNASLFLDKELRRGARVVFEGAQAALLDVSFGTVPFVTSSSTIAGAASTGAGIGPHHLNYVLGVAKAYTTRVGSGPFPTELLDATGDLIRERGREFGTITGRPRRCGWVDIIALKRAIRLNGCTSIALMKLDILSGIETLRICTGYRLDGALLEDIPATLAEFASVEAEFVECEGWTAPIQNAKSLDDLPPAALKYVQRIESLIECPISMVSVSPEREATIMCPSGRWIRQFAEKRQI